MKYIHISSKEDYGALNFEKKYKKRLVSEIINELFEKFNYELGTIVELPLEQTVFVQLFEGKNDLNITFIRNEVQNDEWSKHNNFYFENEII